MKTLLKAFTVCALTLLPAWSAAQGGNATPLADYTLKLAPKPGLVFVSFLHHAHMSDGREIAGDYQSITTLTEVSAKGIGGTWNLTYPANTSGTSFYPFLPASPKVSIYGYAAGPPAGYNTWWRVSDAVYRGLKSGKPTPLEFDGYQSPGTIQKVAEEDLTVMVNEQKVRVRALKGRTPQGWHFWFLDNPDFAIMMKSESAIMNFFVGAFREADSGKDLVRQLKQAGSATSHAIQFAFNSAELTPDSKTVLNSVAEFLKSSPAARLAIEGHTDNIGGAQFNLELSNKRAESVKAYLLQQSGVPASGLSAVGMGMTRPVADNATPEGRAINRRVVFREVK